MFELSTPASKEEYKKWQNKEVMLENNVVTVQLDRCDNRSGSYERGFKFNSITYGLLVRKIPTKRKTYFKDEYSADHGKTWHPTIQEAKKVKGKVIVERSSRGEFAFNSIQKLNRDYYGPSYKWKP